MKTDAICPICGGEMIEKTVEKIVRGGEDTAIIEVQAHVCQKCGERLYDSETVLLFEEVRTKLTADDTTEYDWIGRSYLVG